jgi:D-serine deaminase-like pyridoxal phosphate-dependent protein
VLATVISVSDAWAVADAGLKSLALDHGNPSIDDAKVWFCSDEHVTYAAEARPKPGDRVRVRPAHVDPTVAKHDALHLVEGERVVDVWPVDLRGW